MANTIQVKRKTTTGAPLLASLVDGEFCLVIPDKKLYQRCGSEVISYGSEKLYDYKIVRDGRFYSLETGNWVSQADDNYGVQTENYNESGGTGAAPTIEWENKGMPIEKGETLSFLDIKGRISDIINTPEFKFRVSFVTTSIVDAELNGGYDNDAEISETVLYEDFWKTPLITTGNLAQTPFTHPANDMHRRRHMLNFIAPENGWISVFGLPTRLESSTGTDFFYGRTVYYMKAPLV